MFHYLILQKLYISQLQKSFQSTYIIKCRNLHLQHSLRPPFQFNCSTPPETLPEEEEEEEEEEGEEEFSFYASRRKGK